MPEAVQKSPFGPWQHLPPTPPQVTSGSALLWQTPTLHVAAPLQAAFVALQDPLTQQDPTPVQPESAQQGWLSAPHAIGVPLEQRFPVVVVWPEATQRPGPEPTQHPPAPQVELGQQL